MRPLLLDTVVLLWWLSAKGPLSTGVTIRLRQLTTRVYVSVATAWEICALERKGLVDFGRPARDCLASELTAHRFEWLSLDHRHVFLAQQLAASDLDPYDRLILAQATIEHLVLVTTNGRMRGKGAETMDAREPDWPKDKLQAGKPPTLAAAALAAEAAEKSVYVAPDSPEDRPLPAWNAFPWGDTGDSHRPA